MFRHLCGHRISELQCVKFARRSLLTLFDVTIVGPVGRLCVGIVQEIRRPFSIGIMRRIGCVMIVTNTCWRVGQN